MGYTKEDKREYDKARYCRTRNEQRQRHKEYWEQHKEEISESRKRTYHKSRERIAAKGKDMVAMRQRIKVHYGCLNPACQWFGDIPPYCLDFHHINPDDKLFAIAAATSRSIISVMREINKCTILLRHLSSHGNLWRARRYHVF